MVGVLKSDYVELVSRNSVMGINTRVGYGRSGVAPPMC